MKKQTSAPTGTCLKGKTVTDYSGKKIYVGIAGSILFQRIEICCTFPLAKN